MKSNTKNAKGSGTIRKRSDGRWEARYTTGIDPKTGKQIQKSVYGKTQKEVRQKLTEVTAEIDSGTYLEQTKDTVGEWLDTWLKTYALYSVKSYTYDAYERSCNVSASNPRDEVWAGVSNHPVHRAAGGRSTGADMGLH